MKKCFIFLICIITVIQVFPQLRLRNFIVYGKETGLPQTSYHDVFESSDGYWWIGSSDGLFRFDGKRFQQIISWYDNPNSPTDNNTVDFEEDNAGNLWIAGFTKGLTKYNLRTGEYRQYKRLSQDDNPVYGTFCITKDTGGDLWFGTAGRGLARYLPEKDSFSFYYPHPKKTKDGSVYADNKVTGIVQDQNNNDILWLSCYDGLYLFNKKSGSFISYVPEYASFGTSTAVKTFLCIEQAGNFLYLGTWFEGLMVFDKTKKTFSRITFNNPGRAAFHYGIMDMQMVTDSLLYLACMNDGLLLYNLRTKIIETQITQPDINHLNTEVNIQRVSLTRHAGFFASGNAAIYQLQLKPNPFEKSVNYDLKKIFPREYTDITSVIYDPARKGYWCSFINYAGAVFYDEHHFLKKEYPASEKEKWFDDVAVDAMGVVWSVTNKTALFYLDQKTRQFVNAETIFTNNELAGNNGFRAVESDSKGNLWIAGKTQVLYYHVITKQVVTFRLPVSEINRYSKNGIVFLNLAVDSKKNAWMATNIGLFHFDLASQKTNYYNSQLSADLKLAATSIKSITVDKDDNIWLGYFNEGIQVIDGKQKTIIRSFGLEDGLSSVEINFLACDSKNNILACLHNGLAVFNRRLNAWQVFNALNGLQRDYLDLGVFAFANNKIILDQRNSFLVFNSDSLWIKSDSCFLHITSLKINNKPWAGGQLPDYISSLTLPPGTNDIQIEFSATNWQFPLRTKYYYRVDGVHKTGEWLSVNEARANLTGLASGSYKFRFYAITADGNKTPERVLTIVIKPPFYKTWWFMLLCLISTAGIVYSIFRYRINQLKKMQSIRNNIAKDLHDEIGSTLTSIKILSEVSEKNLYKDQFKTSEFLQKITEQSASAQQGISDIVWALKPENDKLENMVIRMREYVAQTLESKNIQTVINIDEQVLAKTLDTGQRRDFFLIFKEAINNIAKYAVAAKVHISLEKKGNDLLMKITDDGIGFDTARQTSSSGLKNMRSRAQTLKGHLHIESANEKGTLVTLVIPAT